ncbi:hypothetical protein M8I35_11440 [Micromonospora sp. MSM11]|nr:hypothetical protein [Micromonospora sp. MSM11]MCL7457793.1 hypothetical protein [Micromonospora sp. MSM11]
MDIVAQWVRVSWTKQSRGGHHAARRNALPTAFTLPQHHAPLTHEVTMHEHDGFQPVISLHNGAPSCDAVQLRHTEDQVRIELIPTAWGMPRRHRRPPAVRLPRGQWLRWQINYRFTHHCTGDWLYRLDTLNIAHGPVPVDFFLTEPHQSIDERAYLR